jgi:hypothetical protein
LGKGDGVGMKMAKEKAIKKVQSMLEYAVLVAAIGAGLVLMGVYLKRGYSGRIKQQADNLGIQYDPENVNLNYTYTVNSLSATTTYIDNVEFGGNTYLGLISEEEIIYENTTETTNQNIAK